MLKNWPVTYNSHDEAHKRPFGAVEPHTVISFSIETGDLADTTCYLNYYKESDLAEPKKIQTLLMTKDGSSHKATLCLEEVGLYFYWFSVTSSGDRQYYGNSHDSLGGLALAYESEVHLRPFQITCHQYREPAPQWYRQAIFYQIFPDRFHRQGEIQGKKTDSFLYADWYDSPLYVKNDKGEILRWEFAGGNLKGIEEKLDYLKELGISGLYLNPIFEARSNHRYDTGDYHKIDPMLGSLEDFKDLVIACKKKGMGIILDGVFNHTGADSKYFNQLGNYDGLGASQSKDSPYYSWYHFTDYPHKYECWWGVTDLPNVNEADEGYKAFITQPKTGVIPYWLRQGALGWRLDVADELPDFFIKEIRKALETENPAKDKVLIGEVWEDASNKIAYSVRREYLLGEELHGVMNYPLKDAILRYLRKEIRSEDIYRIFMSLMENYPREAFYANFNSLGTHDTPRLRTELGQDSLERLAIIMLMTLPGVPCIYYGDEAGLTGGRDPYNRATFPWGRENTTILDFYREAIALRKSHPVFIEGDTKPFFQASVFGYFRLLDDQVAVIAINPTDQAQVIRLEHPLTQDSFSLEIGPFDYGHKNL